MTFSLGSLLSSCLPTKVKRVVADVIPDRDVLIKIAETLAKFEEDLVEIKKEQTRARDEALPK